MQKHNLSRLSLRRGQRGFLGLDKNATLIVGSNCKVARFNRIEAYPPVLVKKAQIENAARIAPTVSDPTKFCWCMYVEKAGKYTFFYDDLDVLKKDLDEVLATLLIDPYL